MNNCRQLIYITKSSIIPPSSLHKAVYNAFEVELNYQYHLIINIAQTD